MMTKKFISFSKLRADYAVFPENMTVKKDVSALYKLEVGEEYRISTGENIRRIK